CSTHARGGPCMMSPNDRSNQAFDLIVTIVNRGAAEEVIEAAREAGAEGGTILLGRGSGIHDKGKFLGIPIEPAKDVVLTVVPAEKTHYIQQRKRVKAGLDQPGHGIGFVIELKKVLGIAHLANGAEA